MSGFGGYPPAGLDLLAELPDHDRAWFTARRADYERDLLAPTRDLVDQLGAALRDRVSPGLAAEPKVNGSIAPITNDLRFAPGAAPYKDHLLLRFWEGTPKKAAPTLFVRLTRPEVGFATGASFADVARWRAAVADEETGSRLVAALDRLGRDRDLRLTPEDLKRVPGPFPADHPREALLRRKQLQARWVEPTPPQVSGPAFVDWCADRLAATADVHRWLVAALG